jgi:hypothetical protein
MLLAVLLAGAASASSVADAERDFAATAQGGGQWAAFRATAAPDAILYAPARVPAGPWLARAGEPPAAQKLNWRPAITITACDGTLAYSTGPWTRADGRRGSFGTIWRRDADGWRWIYDDGHDGGAMAGAGGPVTETQAACTAPIGSAGDLHEDLPAGAIPVSTLVAGGGPDLVRASDGPMPVALRLGAPEAAGASADRTLQWRINPVLGAASGAHLLRLWSWNGRRYRLVVFDVTGTRT